jgi:hypothetical protein
MAVVLFVLLSFFNLIDAKYNVESSEVLLVIEFARHGARTPLSKYSWSVEEPDM